MDISEIIIFLSTCSCAVVFMYRWYRFNLSIQMREQSRLAMHVLNWLPAISLLIITYTLGSIASFDVVDSPLYTIFYIVIGFAWIYLGMTLISLFYDISWIDDVINLNNKAALMTVAGGFLGITLIYSGANIGDGPGWWCVFFACGLGHVSWLLLGQTFVIFAKVSERITVERDSGCGIRFGFYLVASSISLGYASSGDWTSFYMTVVEFGVGWPVLPITALALAVELLYYNKSKTDYNADSSNFASILWGAVYCFLAVGGIMWVSR